MSETKIDALLNSWDRIDVAVNRVETALPRQMTAAVEELVLARGIMRKTIMSYAMGVEKAMLAARKDQP